MFRKDSFACLAVSASLASIFVFVGCNPPAPPAAAPSSPVPKAVAKAEPKVETPAVKAPTETPKSETPNTPPMPKPDPAAPTPEPVKVAAEPAAPAKPEAPKPPKPVERTLTARTVPTSNPTVILSEEHRKTNLVKVGDKFPTLDLPDSTGKEVSLASLYGERLTIVVFWNDKLRFAREQFDRLQQDVVERYGVPGVNVVTINVGDSAETLRMILGESPKEFPCLLDAAGEAFKKIATEKLPRTYLLDKNGKILWFDIEYSRDMRRELENAVLFFLQETA